MGIITLDMGLPAGNTARVAQAGSRGQQLIEMPSSARSPIGILGRLANPCWRLKPRPWVAEERPPHRSAALRAGAVGRAPSLAHSRRA